MSATFATLPAAATLKPTPFKVEVPQADIDDLKTLLKLSKLPPLTHDNSRSDRKYGVSMQWMTDSMKYWQNEFDWRKQEARFNSYPNFKAEISYDSTHYSVHFLALFSQNPSAVPICFSHGWPGSVVEFMPILDILKERYTPDSLPYHIVVPSLPGYGFSSAAPTDREFPLRDFSHVLNELMKGLGFGKGYVAQGGDIGSFVSRYMAIQFEECKAVHLNFSKIGAPKDFDVSTLNAHEKKGLERAHWFSSNASAYSREHATRPATIGFVLSSNPVALLAWVGEKFLDWVDEPLPLDTILTDISLYWFTNTIATSVAPYRSNSELDEYKQVIKKPFGHSAFPRELNPVPKAWVEKTGDLCFFRSHDNGGHFAALEQPQVLLKDVEDFIAQVWPNGGKL